MVPSRRDRVLVFVVVVSLAVGCERFDIDPQPPQGVEDAYAVPLTAADLPKERKIKASDIVMMPMTKRELDSRGWPLEQVMMSPEQIRGRTLRAPLKAGQPFLTTILYLEGEEPDAGSPSSPGDDD